MSCKSKDIDSCREEKFGCEGCAYFEKPFAKTDVTYCMNEKCETKEECFRYYEHYRYKNINNHSFILKCEEYEGN